MRRIMIGSLALAVAAVASAQPPQPRPQQPPTPRPQQNMNQQAKPAAQATLKDIERAFGFVPQFFRAIPSEMLAAFWAGMQFESSTTTALDPKTKELIGVAVAAQIPCEYCSYYHRQAALAQGATEAEIKDAVGMAAMTRMGSTLLNGLDIDRSQFRKDVDRAMRNMRQQARNTTPPRARTKP